MIRQEESQRLTWQYRQAAPKPGFTLEKIYLLVVIAVSSFVVIFTLVMQIWANPWHMTENKMQSLAKEYYEEYYYPQLLSSGNNLTTMLSKYQESGLPLVYLRQMLLYDDAKNHDKLKYFQNSKINCNTNVTGARFIPFEPYGVKDYRIEYVWSCEKEG